MIVFGGRGSDGAVNDIWAFDLAAMEWENLTPLEEPMPAPRLTPAGVYDEAGGQMLMWSGQGSGFLNDIWAFDLTANAWMELDPPAPMPNIRYGVAAVFDPLNRNLVTFAGFTDEGRFDDTWVFDVEQGQWSDVMPAESPGRRCLHTAAYDSRSHRMIVYGGQRSGPLDDIWSYDLSEGTWTDLTGDSRPQGRYFAASVYDSINDRLLVFGGNRGGAGLSDEMWSFDLETFAWELLVTSGAMPTPREGAVAVYVESEDRVVAFGGRGPGYLNDVWSMDLQSTTTAVRPDETPGNVLRLHPNYPNPVLTTTTIEYEIAESVSIDLAIYDLLGRKVRTLVTGLRSSGRHTESWDGRDDAARRSPPGVYLVHLRGRDFVESHPIVLTAGLP